LVVDDDERLQKLLSKYLTEQGFLVVTASDGEEALTILAQMTFDLLILDVMMPKMDGFVLARKIRERDIQTAILFLTAKGELSDRLTGFETGADDYVLKPFEPMELVMRINAIVRRAPKPSAQKVIKIGIYTYDEQKSQLISEAGDLLALTSTEARLLSIFTQKMGEIISRDEIAKACNVSSDERTIDVQVTRLRRKIEKDSKNPQYLQTVRGKGYVLWGA
jgi:two-component system phosphate regulon response regulator OmpR